MPEEEYLNELIKQLDEEESHCTGCPYHWIAEVCECCSVWGVIQDIEEQINNMQGGRMEKLNQIEDYDIQMRIGRLVPAGTYETTRQGTIRKAMKLQEFFLTPSGEYLAEDWIKLAREAVAAAGEEELLEHIKEHCRKNCAWLHTEKEILEYALRIHTGRIYRYWSDFESTDIDIFFIG